MLAPQALIRGLVSKLIPSINPDSFNNDVAFRQYSYGELMTMPMVRKNYTLVDEGSYYMATNNQSGSAITTTLGFSATAPFITIYNSNPVGGKSIYLDFIRLNTIVAGSAASGLTLIQGAVIVDNINRYSSGGGAIATISNANVISSLASGAVIKIGAITATAANSAHTLHGLITFRPTVSATVADVVGENKVMNFGGVEGGSAGSITVANANIIPVALAPCIIPPGCTGLIYVFYAAAGTPVAAQYAPEIGYWER